MAYPYPTGDQVLTQEDMLKQQTPQYTGPLPTGYSQEEVNAFLQKNPGDESRVMSALNDRGPKAPQYSTPSQQWNSQPSSPRIDDFYKLLMGRAQQSLAVDRNDPTLRAQVDPAVAQQERASRSYLKAVAEKAGPLANLQGEQRLASERSGQAAGQLESQIIGREVDARRQEIAQALQLYGDRLTMDQRAALERELAQLSAETARRGQDITSRGQNLNYDEFLRELALRQYQAQDQSALQWAGFGG